MTTDIWFAAWLVLKGFRVVNKDLISRGKVRLYFEMHDDQWANEKLDFLHSEVSKYKATIEQLKDLGY